ncbi:MAG: CHASE3 domain-containing protein [Saprospiraceae bacterium]
MSTRPGSSLKKHTATWEGKKIVRTMVAGIGILAAVLVGYFILETIKDSSQEKLKQILLQEGVLAELLSTIQEAETSQRGYLLTSNPNFLTPYDSALIAVPELLEQLEDLSGDILTDKAALVRIRGLVKSKFEELRQTIRYLQAGKEDVALNIVANEMGRLTMDSISAEINNLRLRGQLHFTLAEKRISDMEWLANIFQFMAVAAILLIFYLIYSIIRPVINQLVTINKQAIYNRELLQEKNEQLEHFAYIASHDLNQPLRTVKGFVNIIHEDYGDRLDEDGREVLHYITEATDRMRAMINGLLSYSKIGKSGTLESVDIGKLLAGVELDLHAAIHECGALIIHQDMPTIRCFSVEIRQLFQNLLSNALKFRKEGACPKIRVTAVEKPTAWEFCVVDDGIGIEAEQQQKVFSIFTKLHLSTVYEGHGIGLAFAKKIVELHHGRIWVESVVGDGSRFYFTVSKELGREE